MMSPGTISAAATLCRATFAEKVFFCNSGAEAVECALKTARRYHFVNGNPERFRFITFAGAFPRSVSGTGPHLFAGIKQPEPVLDIECLGPASRVNVSKLERLSRSIRRRKSIQTTSKSMRMRNAAGG